MITFMLGIKSVINYKVCNRKHNTSETRFNTLDTEKTEAKVQIFRLKRMIHEAEETLAEKRKEMACMNQEAGKYDKNGNLYPAVSSEPDTNLVSNAKHKQKGAESRVCIS